MNHDYAHCIDCTDDCPEDCFRAQLVRDLDRYGEILFPGHAVYPVSWMHLKGTEECMKMQP